MENAHTIESHLSDAELATFPTAYVTSLRMLNRARVSAGETVLVTGASGGVGSGLVQFARLRGARVIALVGSGKKDQARTLSPESVIAVTRVICLRPWQRWRGGGPSTWSPMWSAATCSRTD